MGGDTAGSNNAVRHQVAHPKVFLKSVPVQDKEAEPMLIGGCGSFRMLQLLEYSLVAPQVDTDKSMVAYLATDFADALRTLFKNKGLAHSNNGVESMTEGGSSFLVGFRGQLYHMYSDYQAFAVKEQEDAAGSGDLLAIGSLVTSRPLKWSPEKRVEAALIAAGTINPFVAGPYNILSI
jgi:hypothetical protein